MELTENELKQKREFIKAQAKKERNTKQYEKSKEECIICDTCARKVSKYYFNKHLETPRHKKWVELQKKA